MSFAPRAHIIRSERCRRRTCEWMYDICDYFQLNREVVGIALFYVDRYFTIKFEGAPSSSSGQQVPVTRKQFQISALTGLYIAVKLHGEGRQENNFISRKSSLNRHTSQGLSQSQRQSQPFNRLKFSLSVCASISRRQFEPSQIEECERKMLSTLNWHLNPIVPSGTAIDSLLVHLPSTADESISLFVYDSAKYLAELSISVPALSLVYKPSVVAHSSILYAFDNLSAKSSDPCSTRCSRQEYERVIHQLSSCHFHREKENVSSAMKILQVICPNLCELFPTSVEPADVSLSPSSSMDRL